MEILCPILVVLPVQTGSVRSVSHKVVRRKSAEMVWADEYLDDDYGLTTSQMMRETIKRDAMGLARLAYDVYKNHEENGIIKEDKKTNDKTRN